MPSRKGSPNRIGAKVKSNVLAVFDQIGGREGMAEWARENRTEFYKLYAKLIPTEVVATVDFRDVGELSDSELLAIATGRSDGALQALPSEEKTGSVH